MAKITDGTLTPWADTQTIHASDYTQDREIFRIAINDNDSRVSTLEQSTAGILLGTAQLQKITNDTGGVKVSASATTDNILTKLTGAGQGMHTFYALPGSVNNPTSNSPLRGIAHITSVNPAYGYVFGFTPTNEVWSNYINADVWTGWRNITTRGSGALWEAVPGNAVFMDGADYIMPTKTLSQCVTGWTLVWSDANTGPNVSIDSDFTFTHIPRYMGSKFSGKQIILPVASFISPTASILMTGKKLFVTDTTIQGHSDNVSANNGSLDVCLRAVLEY